MKTAEGVADEIIEAYNEFPGYAGKLKEAIIKGLADFREETLREAMTTCDHMGPCDDCIEKFREQGRQEIYLRIRSLKEFMEDETQKEANP